MAKIAITWKKSAIGYESSQKRAIEGLGLRRLHQTVEHEDTPSIMGVVHKVRHLVEVRPVESESDDDEDVEEDISLVVAKSDPFENAVSLAMQQGFEFTTDHAALQLHQTLLDAGWANQAEVARKIGMDHVQLNDYLNGKHIPKPEQIDRIESLGNVDLFMVRVLFEVARRRREKVNRDRRLEIQREKINQDMGSDSYYDDMTQAIQDIIASIETPNKDIASE